MPLDHYVSQVHLKNFYSQKLGSLMYAIRKSDLESFTPNAGSVCRIENGSTNSYLRDDRVVEEFLKEIEPKYNRSLEKLKSNKIDLECIYTISGFISYILTCAPAGMRINSSPLKGTAEQTALILDSKKKFPTPPPELGGESLTAIMNSGKLQIEIDPKYPQAIGITNILSQTIMFGNFTWEILVNTFEDSPFFTSDFPVAIEETEAHRILNRIVPLSPNLAIKIRPDVSFDRNQANYSFSNFQYAIREVKRHEVIYINRLIVRCAEDTVFFRDNYDWVSKFVKKNAKFWIEPKTHKLPQENGTLLLITQKVAKRP